MFPLPLDNLDRLRLEEPLSEMHEGRGSSGPTFYRCSHVSLASSHC